MLTRIPPNELADQSVLVRIDAENEIKLRDSLRTLRLLSEAGSRVVIATHYGAPPDAPRLDGLAARLAALLGRPVAKLDEWKGEAGARAVAHLGAGEIAMLENLALEPGERTADGRLAAALAGLCDIYCNDAFALAHEIRASTVGAAKLAKLATAGLAFEKQLEMLETTVGELCRPSLAILGGELSRDKLLLGEEIARRADRTFVAGELALPFLAARQLLPGSPAVEDELVRIAERMTAEAAAGKRVVATPADFTVVDRQTFERLSRGDSCVSARELQNVREDELSPGQIICDIGTATRWSWSDWFGPARTIFWHGPVGIVEIDAFCEGTRFLAREIANRTWPGVHRTIVCGATLFAALHRTGFPIESIRNLTYAGRASLHYFAGRALPAADVLRDRHRTKSKRTRVLIPLDGSDLDASAVDAAAKTVPRDAEIFLLHVRRGPDFEQYPDIAAGLNEAEKFAQRVESERIFARANAILAAHGLLSAGQLAAQGKRSTIIGRYAKRLEAQLIALAANGARETLRAHWIVNQAARAALVARARGPAGTKVKGAPISI